MNLNTDLRIRNLNGTKSKEWTEPVNNIEVRAMYFRHVVEVCTNKNNIIALVSFFTHEHGLHVTLLDLTKDSTELLWRDTEKHDHFMS